MYAIFQDVLAELRRAVSANPKNPLEALEKFTSEESEAEKLLCKRDISIGEVCLLLGLEFKDLRLESLAYSEIEAILKKPEVLNNLDGNQGVLWDAIRRKRQKEENENVASSEAGKVESKPDEKSSFFGTIKNWWMGKTEEEASSAAPVAQTPAAAGKFPAPKEAQKAEERPDATEAVLHDVHDAAQWRGAPATKAAEAKVPSKALLNYQPPTAAVLREQLKRIREGFVQCLKSSESKFSFHSPRNAEMSIMEFFQSRINVQARKDKLRDAEKTTASAEAAFRKPFANARDMERFFQNLGAAK
jgi:hypothetical protein